MIHIVNGLLISDSAILMARRSPDRAQYANTWSFPGGHVEDAETLEQAVAREMMEEIGVTIMDPALMDFTINATKGKAPITFHFFVIHQWNGQPQNCGTEHTDIKWVPLPKAHKIQNLALADYDHLFGLLQGVENSPQKPTFL